MLSPQTISDGRQMCLRPMVFFFFLAFDPYRGGRL